MHVTYSMNNFVPRDGREEVKLKPELWRQSGFRGSLWRRILIGFLRIANYGLSVYAAENSSAFASYIQFRTTGKLCTKSALYLLKPSDEGFTLSDLQMRGISS